MKHQLNIQAASQGEESGPLDWLGFTLTVTRKDVGFDLPGSTARKMFQGGNTRLRNVVVDWVSLPNVDLIPVQGEEIGLLSGERVLSKGYWVKNSQIPGEHCFCHLSPIKIKHGILFGENLGLIQAWHCLGHQPCDRVIGQSQITEHCILYCFFSVLFLLGLH